jgi:xanthine/CO dehydrogenase XdhC/CoxF family maturation factor
LGNRLEQLLELWFHKKDDCQWVLATIFETHGSAYRKAGAKMLINSHGQIFGVLSGGCLESDLMRKAQKCLFSGGNVIVIYDMQDDVDISWQLGIGCGGLVKILLQPIDKSNNYQDLMLLRDYLNNRVTCHYQQNVTDNNATKNRFNQVLTPHQFNQSNKLITSDIFISKIIPKPAIAIIGAGIDAQPMVNIAHSLGWHISLFDSRVNYGRPSYFTNADEIIKQPYRNLTDCNFLNNADVIIIMNHNITLDAEALLVSEQTQALYIGMLGPKHRTEKVLKHARLTLHNLKKPFFNPIGLDLGGELPESIALSILSQAHAYIEKTSALPLCAKGGNDIQHKISSVVY